MQGGDVKHLRAEAGDAPTTSSYRMVPTLHRSALASYLWNCRISGAMYSGDPHSVSARPWGCRLRAKPKSAILSSFSPASLVDSSRFCGFRSLCETAKLLSPSRAVVGHACTAQ